MKLYMIDGGHKPLLVARVLHSLTNHKIRRCITFCKNTGDPYLIAKGTRTELILLVNKLAAAGANLYCTR